MLTKTIFLSYNSADCAEVSRIYELLRGEGLQPWMDRKDLGYEQTWGDELEQTIADRDVFLTFIGNHGWGPWQKEEFLYALKRQKAGKKPGKVIPVVLPSTEGEPQVEGFIDNRNRVDLRADPLAPMALLFNAIKDKARASVVNQQPAPAADPEPDTSSPLNCYLQNVWRNCLELKTTNFEYAMRQNPVNLRLPEVYTPLDVFAPHKAEAGDGPAAAEAREANPRQGVMQAIMENPYLVLTGDPGSGKSTVVDFLTVCLTGEAIGEDINIGRLETKGFPCLIPVRVILRHFAPHGLAKNLDLWEYIKQHPARAKVGNDQHVDCADELSQALQRPDGALLLLDGIDEVPDAKGWRMRLKERVEEFRLRFSHCRILVTSRPYAYQNPREKFSDFTERGIAPFTLEQM